MALDVLESCKAFAKSVFTIQSRHDMWIPRFCGGQPNDVSGAPTPKEKELPTAAAAAAVYRWFGGPLLALAGSRLKACCPPFNMVGWLSRLIYEINWTYLSARASL